MAWSKLEDSFYNHRKFSRMAVALGIRRAEARGLMAGLWSWATTQAPDGDLSDHTGREIEAAMDWEGEPSEALTAAICHGLIDETDSGFILHDWMPRAGSFRKATQKQKERDDARQKRSGPMIYIMSRGDGMLKVGFTSDLKRRVSEYEGGASRLLCSFDGTEDTEKAIHSAARAARIGNSEWFQPVPELREAIASVSRDAEATLLRQGYFGVAGEKRREEKRREERRGEEKTPLSPSKPKPTTISTNLIDAVIANYQTHHPRSRPGDKERKKIRERLKEGYSVPDLCKAIDGCHASAYHCGENNRGKRYQSLDLIMRDADHVTGFIETAQQGDLQPTEPGRKRTYIDATRDLITEGNRNDAPGVFSIDGETPSPLRAPTNRPGAVDRDNPRLLRGDEET